jgi:hypothetical protein
MNSKISPPFDIGFSFIMDEQISGVVEFCLYCIRSNLLKPFNYEYTTVCKVAAKHEMKHEHTSVQADRHT